MVVWGSPEGGLIGPKENPGIDLIPDDIEVSGPGQLMEG